MTQLARWVNTRSVRLSLAGLVVLALLALVAGTRAPGLRDRGPVAGSQDATVAGLLEEDEGPLGPAAPDEYLDLKQSSAQQVTVAQVKRAQAQAAAVPAAQATTAWQLVGPSNVGGRLTDTEDVVELSVRVAEQMGVGEDNRRETELGALLHDIGKIHIPDAIINKPGPLDDDEWAIMKTHTVAGQKMLDQVGGLLGSVGLVVRASHERFDGRGYPDGLSGVAIPLVARIVSACDAFNAMTTIRSYRKAMPVSVAVEEMRKNAGTQFDPAVVDALLAVVGDPGWQVTLAPAAAVTAPARAAA